MSSLVMLSVMPLFNNNLAMAQGYNDDNSYYSQYPTDDKKYECRTGPFEGFFVSSVEFCKHVKFDKDDRKDVRDRDNKTGVQGHRTNRLLKVTSSLQEQQVHKAKEALTEHKVHKAYKEYKAKSNLMEHKALADLTEQRESKVTRN